jgi:NAD(P)-dependent dehydrogenase (short-subunit alcohol dehydrogenase family)
MGRLAGKVALITGAGLGLGRASAELLAREGARPIVTDIGADDLAACCASKGAVRTLTRAVAVPCAEPGCGIRGKSVHPGHIWTTQTETYLAGPGRLAGERARALARHPLGRLGKPEDVAFMVTYLASDDSTFVTGAEMVVDGGCLMV